MRIIDDSWPASSRLVQYGDGLFETIAFVRGKPVLWELHWQRFINGCDALFLPQAEEAIFLERARTLADGEDCIIKWVYGAAQGGRGYQRSDVIDTAVHFSKHLRPLYPASYAQQGICCAISDSPVSENTALAGIKHLNRLDSVLASRQRSEQIAEVMLLDSADNLVEASMSNVFAIKSKQLYTPDLQKAGVAGVMRAYILQLSQQLDIPTHITTISLSELSQMDEVFVCNSVNGIWPVLEILQVGSYQTDLGKQLQQETQKLFDKA